MGIFFAKKIENPEEAYSRLISGDAKASVSALEEFQGNLDSKLIAFLCNKFLEETTLDIRLKILKIFAAKSSVFTNPDLVELLKLTKIQGPKYREAFKDVFGHLDENRLRPLQECMASTTDPEIHIILQSAIEATGIVDKHISKWKTYSLPEKLQHIDEMVRLQSTKLYPIFFEIIQDDPQKSEDKKVLQTKLSTLFTVIKDPAFLELAIRKLPNIDQNVWSTLFKCLQQHGEAFFKALFTGLPERGDAFKLKTMQVLQELGNPLCFPYLLPILFDKAKRIPDATQKAIEEIVRKNASEIEALDPVERDRPEIAEKIAFFTDRILDFLEQPKVRPFPFLGESLLRFGVIHEDTLIRSFFWIVELSQGAFLSYIRSVEATKRKAIMKRAVCDKKIENAKAALAFITSFKAENYTVETIDELLRADISGLPDEVLKELLKTAFAVRSRSDVEASIQLAPPEARARIVEILSSSGIPDVFPLIIKMKNDPDQAVRKAIFKVLSSAAFPPEVTSQILGHFLNDPNQETVLETVLILKDSEHQNALLLLNKLLVSTSDEKIKKATAEAVSNITRRKLFKTFDQVNDMTKQAILSSLLKIDTNFINEMSADIDSEDPEKRKMAAKILRIMWSKIPEENKLPVEKGIENENPWVRSVFVKIVGQYYRDKAPEIIAKTIDDPDPRVRANSIEVITSLKMQDLVQRLQLMIADPHHRIRANALIAMWNFGSQRPDSAIYEMLKPQNKLMQLAAIYAMGEFKEARFFQLLQPLLRNPDPVLRKSTLKSIAKFPLDLKPQDYIKGFVNDPDAGVKQMAVVLMSLIEKRRE
ncbi:MAG: HEAT repeat domain-containing protein [Candidatus Riflebacteria bacterium]|nr:HEAT repeat domain-containing protein [Candidatus Riflebacteria bacterium]